MTEYRISKYDPSFRINCCYIKDEWTDYSDVGLEFNGKLFTETEYLGVESNYIKCIIELLRTSGVSSVYVSYIEKYEQVKWHKWQRLCVDNLSHILRDCLRNICWCRLKNFGTCVYFGHDYYAYVSVKLPTDIVSSICHKYKLFCEPLYNK